MSSRLGRLTPRDPAPALPPAPAASVTRGRAEQRYPAPWNIDGFDWKTFAYRSAQYAIAPLQVCARPRVASSSPHGTPRAHEP